MIRIFVNEVFYIEALVTGSDGNGIEGLEITFSVFDSSTDKVFCSGKMTDVGRGCYKAPISFNVPSQYRLLIETPELYENVLDSIIVEKKSGRQIPH
jgi:hypothetical protein